MAHILVVYYSLTGHTRQVARQIASASGADIDPIVDVAGRQYKPWDMFWLGMRAIFQRPEPIQEPIFDPRDYDLVILGTPVWAGRMAPPVMTYLKQHLGQLKQVALFCTEGGANGERALRQIAELTGLEPKAQLIVTEAELKTGAVQDEVKTFVAALGVKASSGTGHQSAA
jgi:flavodoxin